MGFLIRLCVLLMYTNTHLDVLFILLRIKLLVDVALRTWRHHFQSCITDHNWQTKGKIQHAALAAVLEAGAREAYHCSLLATRPVGLPSEYCEGSAADVAFSAVVFFEHLDEWVVAEARLADAWEVGGFPS